MNEFDSQTKLHDEQSRENSRERAKCFLVGREQANIGRKRPDARSLHTQRPMRTCAIASLRLHSIIARSYKLRCALPGTVNRKASLIVRGKPRAALACYAYRQAAAEPAPRACCKRGNHNEKPQPCRAGTS